ncbi:hypothetical protein FWJ25_11060 [Marinobacter salinexigens]|uniref:ABC-type transport auxiliary lipoprotein component domain-containing protein n=1 Tax=Marinobacter salinexigens TaxID=2919747 RepID=A0A5B0VI59_9GAMM|nr:ABC-type transport auxiliary lipoprotein family protein [Marinobacter salinexigens]KAA1173943.1 hypothetical protein FWJ25_11060 [Marinobacter salinexigens]
MITHVVKRTLGLAAVVTLAGCTVFPNPEPPRVMDLSVSQPVFQAVVRSDKTLRVNTPQASEPFTGTRILAKPTPYEYRVYGKVRWRTTTPVLVRDLLTESLRASNSFGTVISDASSAEADETLVSEVTAFHTESHGGDTNAVITLHAQIVDNRSRSILCSRSFSSLERVQSDDIERVARAFSVAGEILARDISEWAATCR